LDSFLKREIAKDPRKHSSSFLNFCLKIENGKMVKSKSKLDMLIFD